MLRSRHYMFERKIFVWLIFTKEQSFLLENKTLKFFLHCELIKNETKTCRKKEKGKLLIFSINFHAFLT
jgi:hypothetical protein